MTGPSEQQIAQFSTTLKDMRLELLRQLELGEQGAEVVNLDQTLVGRVSRMDAMQQQSMAIATRDQATAKLRKVELALQAIRDGDFGYCRRCDEPIAIARLNAQPESALCIDCQALVDEY